MDQGKSDFEVNCTLGIAASFQRWMARVEFTCMANVEELSHRQEATAMAIQWQRLRQCSDSGVCKASCPNVE